MVSPSRAAAICYFVFVKTRPLPVAHNHNPQQSTPTPQPTEGEKKNAHFRELAMHGSVLPARELWKSGGVCVHATEQSSARNALHKAHTHTHIYIYELHINLKSDLGRQLRYRSYLCEFWSIWPWIGYRVSPRIQA